MNRLPDLDAFLRELAGDPAFLQELRRAAAGRDCAVLMPEADDPRVLLAAAAMLELDLGLPVLMGRAPLGGPAQALAGRLPASCWRDPRDDRWRREVSEHLVRRRRHRGMSQGEAYVLAEKPLYHAASLLALGAADTLVGGASTATAEVVRACLWAIGAAPGSRTVSGAFLMLPPGGDGRPLVMGDCAVVPEPDGSQLVEIARDTGRTYQDLTGEAPTVAMLSFSTGGSSRHPAARRVAEAAAILATEQPDWRVQGEIQADAALVPEVARQKGIDWGSGGTAGVMVFPDLAAGNITTKMVERLGGWRAVGPILQGLRRPVCDLSRGCSARDIVDTAAVAILRCTPRAHDRT